MMVINANEKIPLEIIQTMQLVQNSTSFYRNWTKEMEGVYFRLTALAACASKPN